MTEVRNREIDAAVGDLEFDPYALKTRYEEERDRRGVPEGHGQYVPAIEGKFADYGKDPWVEPGFSRAPCQQELRKMALYSLADGAFCPFQAKSTHTALVWIAARRCNASHIANC